MRHFERGFGTKIKFAGHIRISLKKLRTAVEQLVAGNNTMPCRHRTIKITEWFQPFFLLILYLFLRKLFFAFILLID